MKKVFLILICLFSLFANVFGAEKKPKKEHAKDSGKETTEVAADEPVKESAKEPEVEITTITIKNARETDYRKDEETGNDVIFLDGSVELSVEKGGTVSDISADKITYDRKTEMLYAEGNVAIETKGEGASGGERTTANSLLLNTSTLEGVFDGGRVVQTQSDALNLPSGSTLIVFSDAFGKGSDNVIAFKNSSLTFCEDENPHWHIDATRTWLLPGGEFAFFNALLFVGPVPVMYFPAFYYPKDELVFNPVFSYEKREGHTVQTTTYLHGRKGLEKSTADTSKKSEEEEDEKISSEALYNFMKPTTLKEQRLEGLILHNLDEDYKGSTSEYLKVMADWYSKLGFFVGVDGKFSPSDYITDLSFFLNLGFSKTLFKVEDEYYNFSNTGTIYKDYSTFLGMTLPFRYGANLNFNLSKPFNLSIALPIYSDPYFASDFMNNRRESMDWISFLLDDGEDDKENKSSSDITSFAWRINASYTPTIADIFTPYINSITFSVNSSLNFSSRYNTELTYKDEPVVDPEWKENTPSRSFYYPSLIKPAQVNLNMSGTLFQWPIKDKVVASEPKDYPITLNKPDSLKTEKELEEEKKKNEEKKETSSDKKDDAEEEFEYYMPELSVPSPEIKHLKGLTYNLGYDFGADFSTQIAYPSSNLKKPEDFDWDNIQSFMYTLQLPFTLKGAFNYGQNFFTMNNSISYKPIFQEHPYISLDESTGGYSKDAANSLILADYKSERQDVFSNNNFTIRPLTYIDILKNTSLSLNTNIKLYRREFSGTAEEPKWENEFFDIKDEKSYIDNSLALNLEATELNDQFSQGITFTYIMPPLLKQYKGKLNLKFPFVKTSLEMGIYETTKDDVPEDEKWKKSPLVQDLTVSLFNSALTFTENYIYSMEEEESESLRLAASWNGLNVTYLMSNTYGYDFEMDKGWTIRKEKEFLPYSLSFIYNTPSKEFKTWSDRITFTPGLSTSIVADLIRPTNCYMLFSPSLSFQINNFLKLTFSSTSKNSVLYWYFHNDVSKNPPDLYSEWGGFPGNVVKDLFNSFRFDDEKLREGAGWKLKSLNFDLEHDLHDWKLNMSLKIEPRVITENNKRRYDFNPYFSIGIVWKPMDSMKTEIIDKYGEWEIH